MSEASWEDVERVIAAFLELPEEQRSAYLMQQPGPVRAEVESLLAAYRSAGSFLGSDTSHPDAAELLNKMKLALGAKKRKKLRF